VALFVALGGSAYAFHLGKNSIGPKQLKKNAVTTVKVKNEAITAAKVKRGTLTGEQVNVSTLGTVPNARAAETANAIIAPEQFREVQFLNGWANSEPAVGPSTYSVGLYKDQEGMVHLRGETSLGTPGTAIFRLPPGYRPASGHFIQEAVACFGGGGCPNEVASVSIFGPDSGVPGDDDAVVAPTATSNVFLDGVAFRAES
jgi:hypothetical protein